MKIVANSSQPTADSRKDLLLLGWDKGLFFRAETGRDTESKSSITDLLPH
jgi:hypothetical protein